MPDASLTLRPDAVDEPATAPADATAAIPTADEAGKLPVHPSPDPKSPVPTAALRPRRPSKLRRRFQAFAEAASYTDRQRRAMVAVLALVFGVLLWRAVRDRAYVSDPQPAKPARFDELADRLDPNVAPWEELVALPTLGEKRAKAIVEYRDEWHARHPGEPAYKALIDLAAVKGIGASTLENVGPFVMFPGRVPKPAEPATRQSASAATRSAAKRRP